MGLFEVHFHDSEFRPSMSVGPKGTEEETDGFEFESDESGDEGGRSKVVPLVVLSVVLALVATVAAKKLKGGRSED